MNCSVSSKGVSHIPSRCRNRWQMTGLLILANDMYGWFLLGNGSRQWEPGAGSCSISLLFAIVTILEQPSRTAYPPGRLAWNLTIDRVKSVFLDGPTDSGPYSILIGNLSEGLWIWLFQAGVAWIHHRRIMDPLIHYSGKPAWATTLLPTLACAGWR